MLISELLEGRFDTRDIAGRIVLLGATNGLQLATPLQRSHHERWNGTGYPDALCGEAIPLGARITSVADVWEALSNSRPRRAAYQHTQVREIIEKGAGERFEPALVELLFEILDELGDDLPVHENPFALPEIAAGRHREQP